MLRAICEEYNSKIEIAKDLMPILSMNERIDRSAMIVYVGMGVCRGWETVMS